MNNCMEKAKPLLVWFAKILPICITMLAINSTQAWAQCVASPEVAGQATIGIDWQSAARTKMSFEVASVKPSKTTAAATSNFPLGPGDMYASVGGRFCATNTPAINYISFAYKLTGQQRQSIASSLPGWVSTDLFDVEARGTAGATKDQMRLMMQSLLADRFNLIIRHETKQMAVLALVAAQPGRLGPQLQPHSDDSMCTLAGRDEGTASPAQSLRPTAPSAKSGLQLSSITCGGITQLPASAPGRLRIGAKKVSIPLIAGAFTHPSMGIDRGVIDGTGLTGSFDFSLEYSPERNPAVPDWIPDEIGPTFIQALREQFGLKLQSTSVPMESFVVDRIDRPAEN